MNLRSTKFLSTTTALLLTAVWSSASLAATKIWDGGGGVTNWTNATNWTDDVAPAPGDDLVFATPTNVSNTFNDYPANTPFNSIRITGTSYSLSGNAVTLSNGFTVEQAPGNSNIQLPITLAAAQTFTLNSDTFFYAPIDFNGTSLTLTGGNANVDFYNNIDNVGGLNVSGNLFPEFSSSFNLATGTSTINVANSSQTAYIYSAINGDAALVKIGNGTLFLNGSSTYTGTTTVNNGVLRLQSPTALGSSAAATTVNSGGTIALESQSIGESIVLNGTGFQNQGALQGNGNTFPGTITIASASSITNSLNLTGSLAGTANLTLVNGTFNVFSSTSTYSGTITVLSQIRFIDGSLPQATLNLLNSDVDVEGSATTGAVTLLSSSVRLSSNNKAGIFQTRDLFLESSSFQPGSFASTDAGTGYSQIRVFGSVTLASSNLSLNSLRFIPNVGDQFVIIANDGSDPVNGTFSNLPEGSTIALAGNIQLRISYRGGDGNDVVLTRVIPELRVAAPDDSTDTNPNTIPGARTLLEGDSASDNVVAIFPVTLSFASTQTVTVKYTTQDISAVANSDYVPQSGTLTFAPGQRFQNIIVRLVGDTVAEATEQFAVVLSSPTNATLAQRAEATPENPFPNSPDPARAIFSIEDDDANNAADGSVTINFTNPVQNQGQNGTVAPTFVRDLSTITGTIFNTPGERPVRPTRVQVLLSGAGNSNVTSLPTTFNGTTFTATGLPSTRLTNGAYTITVNAFDASGQNLGTNTLQVVVDLSGPSLTISQPQDRAVLTQFPTILGSVSEAAVTGSGVQKVEYSVLSRALGYFNGRGFQSAPVMLPVTLTGTTFTIDTGISAIAGAVREGDYEVTVRATDVTGNVTDQTRRFTIDLTAPSVQITSPLAGSTLNRLVAITGVVTDRASGIAGVQLFLYNKSTKKFFNGTEFADTSVALPVNYTATTGFLSKRTGLPTASQLTPGNYQIIVKAIDKAGRQTISVTNFVVSSTQPTSGT